MRAKAFLFAAALAAVTAGCEDAAVTEPTAYAGRLAITFDDGWKSAHSRGLPTLRTHGLRGNVAVVTESVDYWEGFLTLVELRELRDAGWSLVSHTVGHPHLPTLTDAELERQLVESKAWLQARGFPGSSVFVVPYHEYGDRELAAIRRHYSAARISNGDFWDPARFESVPPVNPYGLTSIEAELAQYKTEAGRAALINRIEALLKAGKFVDLMFHDITAADFAAFQATIAALAPFKSANVTYHQLFGS